MTDAQFGHLLKMLAGLQDVIKFLAYVLIFHAFTAGPSNSTINSELEKIRKRLEFMR